MATRAISGLSTHSEIPLYRMDDGTYARLRSAGMLEGAALVDGLLVDERGSIHRLDLEKYNEIVATGELEGERVERLSQVRGTALSTEKDYGGCDPGVGVEPLTDAVKVGDLPRNQCAQTRIHGH